MGRKRILVVDDEQKITEVVASYLEHAGYETDVVFNGTDALKHFRANEPALIILDLMLPDISGEEICRRIRLESRGPVLMLTAKVEERDVLKGFSMGTDDYLTKPFSPRELVMRVKALLKRTANEPLHERATFNSGDLDIDFTRHEVHRTGREVALTPNEYNILKTFAAYPGKVFSRAELIRSAFSHDYEGYDRTIDTHIKNLRQKIETDMKNPVYIQTVHGIGYKFAGVADDN